MPGDVTFPLVSAAEAALKELDDPRLTELQDIEAVPVPFVDSDIKPKARRVYVAYSRMLKIGATKGCKGCENDTSSHNQECIALFEEAFGRKDADGSFVEPDVPASSEVPAIEPMFIRKGVPVVVLQKTLSLRQIMMNLMKPNLQSKILLMSRFMIQTLMMNLINLLPLV